MGSRAIVLRVNQWRRLRLSLLEQCSKLISPIHVVRMSSLQRHELLTRHSCIAPKLCQEINNPALLGDLSFRDIHLSNSLNKIVHDRLSIHPHQPPLIRVRWWLSHTAELREALNISVSYAGRPCAGTSGDVPLCETSGFHSGQDFSRLCSKLLRRVLWFTPAESSHSTTG